MDDKVMYPSDARLKNLTYASKIVATVTQLQEITDISTGEVINKIIGQPEHEYPITNIPIMVRSKYCSTSLNKSGDNSECDYDPGGYFIVNGSEKVVMSLERIIENRPLVFIKKESGTIVHTIQVNSKSFKTEMMQIINIRLKKDNSMMIRVPILNEIPVFILLRALGIESDKDIENYVNEYKFSFNLNYKFNFQIIEKIDNYYVEATPAGEMIVIQNHDRPGIIGNLGTRACDSGAANCASRVRRRRVGEYCTFVQRLLYPVCQSVVLVLCVRRADVRRGQLD
jgi:DNA-directed RNA polymerase beta subunit